MASTKRTCTLCDGKFYARGYCRNHYETARSKGEFGNGAVCSAEGCEDLCSTRGYCRKHYQRWRKWGDPNARDPKFTKRRCSIDNCDKDAFCRGWCRSHYDRWYEQGDPLYRRPGEVVNGKRICSSCGVDTPVDEMRRTLCAPCMSERSRSYYSYTPRTAKMICEVCDSDYIGHPAKTKYCSDKCRTIGLEATKTIRDRRIRQSKVEHFTRREIFERDGWVCHICDHAIPKDLKFPDPLSASLDHVTPISLGGEHSRENTAASHLRCNIRKGARMAA